MANLREIFEKEEHERLSEYAAFSDESKGRDVPEEESDIRTVYQRDRDRILHSKSFRRLKHKTQVFLAPYGDHYRTRLTHTLEVSQIARTIAKALRCNEELTEAIALAHDIGHTPFGHVGERTLSEVSGKVFNHNEHGVRVVEVLEKRGRGLNLTWEVRDGIRNHKTSLTPATLEGKIVRISDKIAYISHDIDDGIRAGVLSEAALPEKCTRVLGNTTRNRINNLIHNVIENSLDMPDILLSPETLEALMELREYMFENLYRNERVKKEEKKAAEIIRILYNYFMEDINRMPSEYIQLFEDKCSIEIDTGKVVKGKALDDQKVRNQLVCDYIAGMTDNFAVETFEEIYIPRSWGFDNYVETDF